MKQNYRITLTPKAESRQIQTINFRGTMWQAKKAFDGLRIALHNSDFKKITLALMGKNETGYPINVVVLKGGNNGL